MNITEAPEYLKVTTNPVYPILSLDHYTTILDSKEEKIDISKLKEYIKEIFNKNFDAFFSDYFPEELYSVDGKVNTYKIQDFDNKNGSDESKNDFIDLSKSLEKNETVISLYKTKIEESEDKIIIHGLNGIKIVFEFKNEEFFNKVSVDIYFSKTQLTKKEELYIDLALQYLKDFGLEFNNLDIGLNKKITCKDGVCNFVSSFKEDIQQINNLELEILKFLKEENFLELQKNFDDIKDKKLYKNLKGLNNLKKKISDDEYKNIKDIENYNKKKLDIIFYIVFKQYIYFLIVINSYLNAIKNEIGNRKINIEIDEIINNELGISISQKEKEIYEKVKSLLIGYQKVYTKKYQEIENSLKNEAKKKKILELGIKLGQEIPVILDEINKEIPYLLKFKQKLLSILPEKKDEEKQDERSEEKGSRKRLLRKIQDFIEGTYNNDGDNIVIPNCKLWFHGLNREKFYQKGGFIYIKTEDKYYKIINIVDEKLILGITEIEEQYSNIIDRKKYKFLRIYDESNYEIIKEMINLENKEISNHNLGNLTGEYADINGQRFVQFDEENNKRDKFYISLENFKELRIESSWIVDIDDKEININGKKYICVKQFEDDEDDEITYNYYLIALNNLTFKETSEYIKIKTDDLYEGKVDSEILITEKGKYYKIKNNKNVDFINIETGELLGEKIYKRLKKIKIDYPSLEELKIKDIKYIYEERFKINIREYKRYAGETTDIKEFYLYFDGNDFIKTNDGSFITSLKLKKIGNQKIYKGTMLSGKNLQNTVNRLFLPETYKIITINNENYVKIGEGSFEYNGKIYQKFKIPSKNRMIIVFINYQENKAKYTEKDIFYYTDKDGKKYKVIGGKNKENGILELKIELENGETTFVSISNNQISNNQGKIFFNKLKSIFN